MLIIFTGCFFLINGNPTKITEMENDIRSYLASDRGYSREEISSIEVNYEWMKTGSYRGKVVFTDEPNNFYVYDYDGEGDIYQSGMLNIGKHRE